MNKVLVHTAIFPYKFQTVFSAPFFVYMQMLISFCTNGNTWLFYTIIPIHHQIFQFFNFSFFVFHFFLRIEIEARRRMSQRFGTAGTHASWGNSEPHRLQIQFFKLRFNTLAWYVLISVLKPRINRSRHNAKYVLTITTDLPLPCSLVIMGKVEIRSYQWLFSLLRFGSSWIFKESEKRIWNL